MMTCMMKSTDTTCHFLLVGVSAMLGFAGFMFGGSSDFLVNNRLAAHNIFRLRCHHGAGFLFDAPCRRLGTCSWSSVRHIQLGSKLCSAYAQIAWPCGELIFVGTPWSQRRAWSNRVAPFCAECRAPQLHGGQCGTPTFHVAACSAIGP